MFPLDHIPAALSPRWSSLATATAHFRRVHRRLNSCLLQLLMVWNFCAAVEAQEVGPPQGSLLIVGGGGMDLVIRQKFLELAGGPEQAQIVVIPTAAGEPEYSETDSSVLMWKRLGVERVSLLHTNDREIADSAEFVAPLQQATAVWLGGGRQWRLADSYLNTRTQREIEAVLARGGVIGGSSAGATIQGSYLARGDSRTNEIMMGDHEEGFGLLKNVAIDQHLLARNRQFDLLEIISARPELLGIGIDENTAIIVQGDIFEVLGRSYVAVYDAQAAAAAEQQGRYRPFVLLSSGARYHLAKRQVLPRANPATNLVPQPALVE